MSLDTRAYPLPAQRMAYYASQPGKLSFDVQGEPADPIISLVVPQLTASREIELIRTRFRIEAGKLQQLDAAVDRESADDLQVYSVSSIEDDYAARIVVDGERIACYRAEQTAPDWEGRLEPADGRRHFFRTSDPRYLLLQTDEMSAFWDCRSGRRIWSGRRTRIDGAADESTERPLLLVANDIPFVVQPTREGVRISATRTSSSSFHSDSPLSIAPNSTRDPRVWRVPVASPLHSETSFMDFLTDLVKLGIQSLFALICPAGCLFWLVRHRRFTLGQLLLAPALMFLCVMTWRSMLLANAIHAAERVPWFVVLFSGTMVVAAMAFVVHCLVEHRGWLLGLVLGLAAVTTALLQVLPATLSAGDLRYQLGWDHYLAGMIASALVFMPLAYVFSGVYRWIRKRSSSQVVHG
jgi:hypothetical protein